MISNYFTTIPYEWPLGGSAGGPALDETKLKLTQPTMYFDKVDSRI